ncbi:MAG: GNAT family N-acetyltransferase [bacterium]
MITFRHATPDDIPLLQRLADAIWHEAFADIITREQIDLMLSRMYAPETIRSEMAGGVVWQVLEENGTPLGYVSYSMIEPAVCKLHKIYVLPAHHGRGLGKRCLAEAADFARTRGAVKMILQVNRRNFKAQRAYRAFGFRVEESVDWEFAPGFMLDDYKMSLPL